MPICVKKERNAQASQQADQGFSIPPFLVAQNLSSKRIAPTGNMRPKFHDEHTRHTG